MEKLSSDEWCKSLDIIVLDPDGWNRKDFNYSCKERITIQEFYNRLSFSTISLKNIRPIGERINKHGSDNLNTSSI